MPIQTEHCSGLYRGCAPHHRASVGQTPACDASTQRIPVGMQEVFRSVAYRIWPRGPSRLHQFGNPACTRASSCTARSPKSPHRNVAPTGLAADCLAASSFQAADHFAWDLARAALTGSTTPIRSTSRLQAAGSTGRRRPAEPSRGRLRRSWSAARRTRG